MKMTVFWVVASWSGRSLPTFERCLLCLMMEAATTSETSVNFYQTTRRSIPEDSHLLLEIEPRSFSL
jgi:hypothetical protein